jgi:apolipoprotein N-acyltransferase
MSAVGCRSKDVEKCKVRRDVSRGSLALFFAPSRLCVRFLLTVSSAKPWILALLGAILLWASFPPLDWWLLAWIAPIPWILLIRREKLDGRRPYRVLWLAGFVTWMGTLHFLRLPHWATNFGWVALSGYFAFYLPLFVGLSRVAVHRLRVPVMLVAPMVWTGLELVRGHLLTGMTMACLGHTQYRWIDLIQVSDLVGAYGVSFLVMFVAACLARMYPMASSSADVPALPSRGVGRRVLATLWPLLPAAALLAAVLLYGRQRTDTNPPTAGPRIALIQGSIDVEFPNAATFDERKRLHEEWCDRVYSQHLQLSREAIQACPDVDLLVWPESMFPWGIFTFDPSVSKPPAFRGTEVEFRTLLQELAEDGPDNMIETASALRVPLLVGTNVTHLGVDRERTCTSAVHVSREGKVLGQYDKIHLVMFGEYMPFVEWFPWLQNFTPLTGNATPGDRFVAIDVRGVRVAPSICYENVLSHFIRRQVNALAAEGREPDVLINLTNDGWFWGSSELDLHLMCGVFRAVECRKPFLVAANTGFSAWIDGDGRIIQQGPRRDNAFLIAQPRLDRRHSWYLEHGDWFAGACLAGCLLLGVVGLRARVGGISKRFQRP